MGCWWTCLGLLILTVYCACSRQLNLIAAASPCDYSAQICGDVRIPYPFGMSGDCAGLPGYRILCKLNPSYGEGLLPFLQMGTDSTPAELQVLEFSSYTNTIIVNSTELKAMPTPDKCGKPDGYAEASLELPSSGPFVLSNENVFAVIGCGSHGSCAFDPSSNTSPNVSSFTTTIQCSTGCSKQCCFGGIYDEDITCYPGYACCINPIPSGSRYLNFNGTGKSDTDSPAGLCGFSTVLSPEYWLSSRQQAGFPGVGQALRLSISWALLLSASENCSTAKQRSDYACSEKAECVYRSNVPGYTCFCPREGDGYKYGTGCKGDGTNYTLVLLIALEILIVSLAGAFILTMLILIVRYWRRAYRRKQQRKENFHRNGGEELRSMLFSEDELRRATDNFSPEHELGKGGYGTVFWGNLPSHGKVAIKKPKHMQDANREEDQMKSFVSEILLLGKTTHKNVVRLLGCCVETRVPLLVYEFVENGTLWDHLHPDRDAQTSLVSSSWLRRLNIAVDTAKALSYLHKMRPPILHRDIKSTNILIDKSYNPKVGDFGASRFLTSDATHLSFAVVVGTHGYLDPEYHWSCQFTNKSDVYSFGVLLLELITSMPADLGTKLGILAHHFQIRFRNGNLTNLIDPRLSTHPGVLASIQDVANLAIHCVAIQGSQRPTMEEVLGKLEDIQSKWMLVDELVGPYTQGPIISPQSFCNNTEQYCESVSLLGYSWTNGPSHDQCGTTIAPTITASEIALMSLESFQSIPAHHRATTL